MMLLEISEKRESKNDQRDKQAQLVGHVFNLHLCNFPISGHPCEDTFKKLKRKIYFSKMFADLHSTETNDAELPRQRTVGNRKDDSGSTLFHGRRSGFPRTEKSKSAFT